MSEFFFNILLDCVAETRLSFLKFDRPHVIPIGVDTADYGNHRQHRRDDEQECRRDLALDADRAGGLQEGRDAVIFKGQHRLGLRATKTRMAQGFVFSVKPFKLALKVGDFWVVRHTVKLNPSEQTASKFANQGAQILSEMTGIGD